MATRRRRQFLTAGTLVCIAVYLRTSWVDDGSEFWAGQLARWNNYGFLLFLLTLALLFVVRRAAMATGLIACFFSLPLYLDLVFPRPFRSVWPGIWKTATPQETFVWDGWWITGIIAIAFVAGACIYGLIFTRREGRSA